MISETKIAIPIMQTDIEDVVVTASDYIEKGADLLEVRVDRISYADSYVVKEIIEEIAFPVIVTNRGKGEGGYFLGSERERIDILESCCDLEYVEYIDIELKSDVSLRNHFLSKCHETGVKTIVSFHDFEKTPSLGDLSEIVKEEKSLGDIAKIAVMPKDLEDTIIVLAIMSRCKDTIAISMGELGSYTRLMASKFNAPISFATGGDVTAPGQIDIETMKLMLNMDLMDHDDLLEHI